MRNRTFIGFALSTPGGFGRPPRSVWRWLRNRVSKWDRPKTFCRLQGRRGNVPILAVLLRAVRPVWLRPSGASIPDRATPTLGATVGGQRPVQMVAAAPIKYVCPRSRQGRTAGPSGMAGPPRRGADSRRYRSVQLSTKARSEILTTPLSKPTRPHIHGLAGCQPLSLHFRSSAPFPYYVAGMVLRCIQGDGR